MKGIIKLFWDYCLNAAMLLIMPEYNIQADRIPNWENLVDS